MTLFRWNRLTGALLTPRNSFLLLLVASLAAAGAMGCSAERRSALPPLERRAQEINKAIMCPVCPGESIDQSQNALAKQMRAVVVEKLEGGWDEEQIKAFFVERYGPRVLMAPPRDGFNIVAWALPPGAVLIAAGAAYAVLRRMRKPSPVPAQEELPLAGDATQHLAEYARRLEGLLGLDGSGEQDERRQT